MENELERQRVLDPVVEAAKTLLGVGYLYPYQRLVVANILESAVAAGIQLAWPQGVRDELVQDTCVRDTGVRSMDTCGQVTDGQDRNAPEAGDLPEAQQDDLDREAFGRQIVILPTGAGKSLCFQLPALLMAKPTLVLYPILSLMADQKRRLEEKGFEPVLLRGGQTREERERIWNRIGEGKARFIIANPEVLLTEGVRRRLGSLGIAHLVLDEAHCVSEWGESFRPSYLRVAEILTECAAPLATAFTATASPPVLDKIRRYVFGDAGAHRIIGNPDRPNIDYSAQGAILRDVAVRDYIRTHLRPAIVFCSSRTRTEQLARYLQVELEDKEIRFYHAGLEREEKKAVEDWFFASPQGILCATCAYGMGVDKANIRTVVHRDCPPSVEAYLQESGRAGRDGLASQALFLWGPEDEGLLNRLAPGPERDRKERLLEYGKGAHACRREALLSMLGTEGGGCVPGPVACDVCRGTAKPGLREEASLKSFISRNRRRYDEPEAAAIIAESEVLGVTMEQARLALRKMQDLNIVRKSKVLFFKNRLTCP